MNRWIILMFGLFAYAFGLASLVLFILFVGGWAELPMVGELPWKIDEGGNERIGSAIFINLLLVGLFALQHSVMARPGFKRALTQFFPKAAERSLYCVATGVVIWLMVIFWQPLPGTVWHVEHAGLAMALTVLQLFGWGTAVSASFMINHFELFGLQQTVSQWAGRTVLDDSFYLRFLYRFVRHPLQLGILLGIWATPLMSMSHLLMSVAMTAYILVGIFLEERDLVVTLGQDYERYRQEVPMLVPSPRAAALTFTPTELLDADTTATESFTVQGV